MMWRDRLKNVVGLTIGLGVLGFKAAVVVIILWMLADSASDSGGGEGSACLDAQLADQTDYDC